MNRTLKKFLAGATMVAMGTVAIPFWALAADTAPVANNQAIAQVDETGDYYSVRDTMTQLGIKVGWEKIKTEKIILSSSTHSYEVVVDRANKQVMTSVGSFHYELVDNKIQLPAKFFSIILNNVDFYESNGFLNGQVSDGSRVAAIVHLPDYVQETKPVAQPQAQSATFFESGIATWYGSGLHGHYTASGEVFNMYDYTAAHKTLPFGTRVRVTNQNNGQAVIVRITDRGPFAPGRVIDLSMQAAADINMVSSGIAPVSIEILN